jgi:hypothetical protein
MQKPETFKKDSNMLSKKRLPMATLMYNFNQFKFNSHEKLNFTQSK